MKNEMTLGFGGVSSLKLTTHESGRLRPVSTDSAAAQALRSMDNVKRTIAAARAIRSAVESLAAHPLLGRCLHGDIRELVTSFGQTGYIALYRFVVPQDEVRMLAIRRQREIGFLP